MTSASNIPADDEDDFMRFCVQRNRVLPAGVYVTRLVPKTARLLGKDDAFDYSNLSPDKVRGLQFRFKVLEASDQSQVGREFHYGFALDGPSTLSQIIEEDLRAIYSWKKTVGLSAVPAGRLDLLAQGLEQGSAGRLLKMRISHRNGPRIRVEKIRLVEEPQ
jgi:hypothetical protein